MAINRNSITAEEIRDVFKMQQNVDGIISNVAGQIIPVVDVNPKHARRTNLFISADRNATTAGFTIGTASTSKETFITGVSLSNDTNAAADNTILRLTAFVNGAVVTLIRIAKLTMTASKTDVYIPFNNPIRIDKGSNIQIVNVFTVGASNTSAAVFGFEVENPNA